jgi:GMP synthase (glutamine-hydrolysing)
MEAKHDAAAGCFQPGALAAALDAKVYPGGAGKKIGWSALTAPGPAPAVNPLSPLFRPGVQVLHWHGGTFELHAGVTALAGTSAIRIRPSRWARMRWRCSFTPRCAARCWNAGTSLMPLN